MKTIPITDTCSRNLNLKNHVCFGISPFNSYFSEDRIRKLAEWGKQEFKTMHFFVPDVPSAYTLEALGYDVEKSAWKARRQSQYLFNKIKKALSNIGFSQIHSEEMILNWDRLSNNGHYSNIYNEVKALFERDVHFQSACIEASRWVLEKRVPDSDTLSPETLRSAVRYLLTEIPLFLDTAGIVKQPGSVFCYHQCISFIENLLKGYFNIRKSVHQGFVVIEDINQAKCQPGELAEYIDSSELSPS